MNLEFLSVMLPTLGQMSKDGPLVHLSEPDSFLSGKAPYSIILHAYFEKNFSQGISVDRFTHSSPGGMASPCLTDLSINARTPTFFPQCIA